MGLSGLMALMALMALMVALLALMALSITIGVSQEDMRMPQETSRSRGPREDCRPEC